MKTLNTKHLVLVLSMVSLINVSFAQKYKVKDDMITRDKAPVGKLTGDAGVDKTNLVIFGNSGEKVLSMSQGTFDPKNPFFRYISWYNVKFEDTGKSFVIYHAGNCGPKCVLNNALAPVGIVFDGTVIKNQDDIIAKNDIAAKIAKDTTEILSKHNTWLKLLSKNKILRDTEKPVVLTKESEGINVETTRTVYNVVQDNIVVGKVIRLHTQSSTRIETTYEFYETLYAAEEGMTDVPAGRVTDTFFDVEFVTIVDGKKHKIKTEDKANAQKLLATYLVGNGYF
jgi:hypothetical protein